MHIYIEDNLVFPFQAKLKGKKSEEITVTGIARGSLGHCVACKAKVKGVLVKIPVTELEPIKSRNNAMIIGGYVAWLKGGY